MQLLDSSLKQLLRIVAYTVASGSMSYDFYQELQTYFRLKLADIQPNKSISYESTGTSKALKMWRYNT